MKRTIVRLCPVLPCYQHICLTHRNRRLVEAGTSYSFPYRLDLANTCTTNINNNLEHYSIALYCFNECCPGICARFDLLRFVWGFSCVNSISFLLQHPARDEDNIGQNQMVHSRECSDI